MAISEDPMQPVLDLCGGGNIYHKWYMVAMLSESENLVIYGTNRSSCLSINWISMVGGNIYHMRYMVCSNTLRTKSESFVYEPNTVV